VPWHHPGVLLAHLSDLHITAPGRTLQHGIDTAPLVAAAVAHLGRLDPAPDAVLLSGDLVDEGTVAEYERLRDLLAPVEWPLVLMPGNHDDVAVLTSVFGEQPTSMDLGHGRLLTLDSTRPGEPGGTLDDEQLVWLDRELAACVGRTTVVALHHPPFPTGIGHMDAMGLEPGAAQRLGAVVRRHSHVVRVLCGHVHRLTLRRWHGTVAMTVPSVAHQVALDLRPGGPPAITREPPAYALHVDVPGEGLVTHLAFPGSDDEPRVLG